MRIGVFFNWQNGRDWDRFLAKAAGPPAISDADIYDEELRLARLVEPLGYDSYWAIDHYVTPYGMTGGALQHLTYMAGQTNRIDFGTCVIVLPWYHPMKVAHEISVLDNVLQGRKVTLGLGRGVALREFETFGVPMGEARGRFNESLDVLRLAMSQEWFSYDGEFFKIPETSVRPAFRNPQRLMDSMRVAWVSPETLPIAANNGLGMLMTNSKSWDQYRADVAGFNRIRADRGWAPAQPTVIVRCTCFETEAEAWDAMARHSVEATRSTNLHYQLGDTERLKKTKGYESYAAMAAYSVPTEEQVVEAVARPQAWGTPDQVFEKLKMIQRMTSAEEFVLNLKFGTMPADVAERSMRLFASEVLPRIHELEAPVDPDMFDLDARLARIGADDGAGVIR